MEIIKDEEKGLEFVFITNEDGTTLSMTKAEYDRRQVEHLTEIPTKEAK